MSSRGAQTIRDRSVVIWLFIPTAYQAVSKEQVTVKNVFKLGFKSGAMPSPPGHQSAGASGSAAAAGGEELKTETACANVIRKMCIHHYNGFCERGRGCTFAHSEKELRSTTWLDRGDLALNKIVLCKYHAAGASA